VEVSATGRRVFGAVAALVWFSLALNLVITALGVYPATTRTPTLFGYDTPDGLAGALSRVVDFFSYFTILSNIVVAVVLTALARGVARPVRFWPALRMDSLIMITVTGLVFAIVLAPEAQLEGLEYVTNTIEHYLAPVLTVVTWLVWGPFGWFRLSTVLSAMVLPVLWLGYTLVRGAVINAYPYGFIDAAALGYPTALRNIAGVLVIGIVLALVFLGLDRLRSRRSARS
jgi:hypothetical protein